MGLTHFRGPDFGEWRQELGRVMDWPMRILSQFGADHGPVDIVERMDDIVVRLEVPGVRSEDIDLRVTSQAFTVQGETRRLEQSEEGGVYHSERRYGRFFRTIPLPIEVKPETAVATIRHGVLEVHVDKVHSGGDGQRVQIRNADGPTM